MGEKGCTMGFFDKLFGKKEAPAAPRPDSIATEYVDNVVVAPSTGQLIAMPDIPDPVFSGGAMGKAVGIKPSKGIVYAPVTGVVTATMPGSLHAVGLNSDSGVEVLIHVGVDTVEMKGDGFAGFVEKGEHVTAGQPLISFDLAKIAAAGHSDCVITVVLNGDDYASVDPVDAGSIEAGQPIIKLAD
jgi:glucose-specific phosphotransferase system IIA component